MQIMKLKSIQIITLSILPLLPLSGSGAALGTRQRTIRPTVITNVPGIFASDLALYATNGYSSWQWGPGADESKAWSPNMPAGYTGATIGVLVTPPTMKLVTGPASMMVP